MHAMEIIRAQQPYTKDQRLQDRSDVVAVMTHGCVPFMQDRWSDEELLEAVQHEWSPAGDDDNPGLRFRFRSSRHRDPIGANITCGGFLDRVRAAVLSRLKDIEKEQENAVWKVAAWQIEAGSMPLHVPRANPQFDASPFDPFEGKDSEPKRHAVADSIPCYTLHVAFVDVSTGPEYDRVYDELGSNTSRKHAWLHRGGMMPPRIREEYDTAKALIAKWLAHAEASRLPVLETAAPAAAEPAAPTAEAIEVARKMRSRRMGWADVAFMLGVSVDEAKRLVDAADDAEISGANLPPEPDEPGYKPPVDDVPALDLDAAT